MQLTYPSKFHSKPGERLKIIAYHAVPVLIMSFCFACTDTIDAYFPVAGKTLRWGGDFSSWPSLFISVCALAHSGVVALGFVFTMERRVWAVHVFFLYCVIGTLAVGFAGERERRTERQRRREEGDRETGRHTERERERERKSRNSQRNRLRASGLPVAPTRKHR